MLFHSILYEGPIPDMDERIEQPAFFTDLNLDQVVDAVTQGREQYDLKPFFYEPLHDRAAVTYRHDVLRDTEREDVARCIERFADGMRRMREQLAQGAKLHYTLQKRAWFLDAVTTYVDTLSRFADDLARAEAHSDGLQAFGEYLGGYVRSDAFSALAADTRQLKEALSTVRYSLAINGSRIRVDRYDSEVDYSAQVQRTFAKFRQGAVEDYRVGFRASADMNHVEARILEFVAQLYPEVFDELESFCQRHRSYLDPTVAAFDREIQFYLAHRDYIARLAQAGLGFCYPHVSASSKQLYARDTFDIALAGKLTREQAPIVRNDWHLTDPERIFVVSGPNQGGKTTFARTFGQLHYLASLGLTVPGTQASLFLADEIFTHFEKEEELTTHRGKLEDDLARVHDILQRASPQSVVVMNESFSSTALQDALFLGKKVLRQIIELDVLCVYVTFVDELASLDETIVSIASTVDPQDPAVRTFKVVRQPADGLAYAAAIAEKYRLTYETLRERVAP